MHGALQVCAGCEAAACAYCQITLSVMIQVRMQAVLLVNASNAFNSINK